MKVEHLPQGAIVRSAHNPTITVRMIDKPGNKARLAMFMLPTGEAVKAKYTSTEHHTILGRI